MTDRAVLFYFHILFNNICFNVYLCSDPREEIAAEQELNRK